MIKKYISGNPINTDAVIICNELESNSLASLRFFDFTTQGNELTLSYTLSDDDAVYGLGEANRGINKRGYRYVSYCSDDPNHTEEKESLYGAHNFIIIHGSKTFGVFIDCPSKVEFDIGYEKTSQLTIKCVSDVTIYILTGDSCLDIVSQFRKAIGQSYIPPRWAFGYQQCRWSYFSAEEIKDVVKKYSDAGIPLDAIYMDIDYMERYKDFTIDDSVFPGFQKFVKEMASNGIHLVPIIDAGVKIEEGYDVYEEGVKDNHFCKDEDGNDFIAAVWPGYTHFPDFLNSTTRKWFGNKYRFLIEQGIDGFWNDMNEPAIFYSAKGIENAITLLKEIDTDKITPFNEEETDKLFKLKDALCNLANQEYDYNGFYHNMDGRILKHNDVHNLYGYNMTRAAGEAFNEIEPDKRLLLFSRSSYIGMHRYGGIWTGDNHSWWSHILLNLKMMPSLNMCGFLYTGADLGGFGCNTSRELLIRWLALGIFTPLMRNHSALNTRRQEAYQYENTDEFKRVIDIRYSLIPYIYSEFVKSSLNNSMYFKPLAFDYPNDPIACEVEDQLMLGEGLMIAPVYTQNAKRRYVYLPEDMLYIKFKGYDNKKVKVMEKGHHCIEVALDEIPLFVRKNHILLLTKPQKNTQDLDYNNLDLYCYNPDKASVEYQLFNDDGYSKNYSNPDNFNTIRIENSSNGFKAKATIPLHLNLNIYE